MSSIRTINDLPHVPQLTKSRSSFVSSLIPWRHRKMVPKRLQKCLGSESHLGKWRHDASDSGARAVGPCGVTDSAAGKVHVHDTES
jgi:hypothetical protein